jgi:phage shock protein A
MISILKTYLSALTDPIKYILIAAAVLLVLLAAAFAGAKVQAWRSTALYESQLSALTVQIGAVKDNAHQLELGIATQNTAVEVAKAKTEAAQAAKQVAEDQAALLAQQSTSRLMKLSESLKTATSCKQVLSSYWELRR